LHTEHRTVVIIFPLILQKIVTSQTFIGAGPGSGETEGSVCISDQINFLRHIVQHEQANNSEKEKTCQQDTEAA